MTTTHRSKQLAKAVEDRRKELGYDPSGFAKATGLTTQALGRLRRGEVRNYQERLTREVCRVLRWTPDSIDRLLADQDPITIGPDGTDPDVLQRLDQIAAEVHELRRRIQP